MIDCSTLSKGGGVQVALSYLDSLCVYSGVEILVVLPKSIYRLVSEQSLSKFNYIVFDKGAGFISKLKIRFFLMRINRDFSPDLTFTVFGPAYFRADGVHLVGFALPSLIYPGWKKFRGKRRSFKDVSFDYLRRFGFLGFSAYVVETETVRRRMSKFLGVNIERIFVIPNGLNPRLLSFNESGLCKSVVDQFVILVPSAYYPHKNLEFVVDVARLLASKIPNLVVRFTLSDDDWSVLTTGVDLVSGVIENLGVLNLEDLANAYLNCDFVFLPTVLECSTAVFPESFFFSRPLITSDLDFCRELCGDAACFVNPLDSISAASEIFRLYSSKSMQARLVVAGRNKLQESYPDSGERAAMLMRLFARLIQN